jgi:hypothetical protein
MDMRNLILRAFGWPDFDRGRRDAADHKRRSTSGP